jgi:hypothetical protein
MGADMPDAGPSRKRQIQVTPGPFSEAAASGTARAMIVPVYEGFFEHFAISGAETGINKVMPRGDFPRPCRL